jgi:hypothetical protein
MSTCTSPKRQGLLPTLSLGDRHQQVRVARCCTMQSFRTAINLDGRWRSSLVHMKMAARDDLQNTATNVAPLGKQVYMHTNSPTQGCGGHFEFNEEFNY